jgi:hypothetical protein
VKRIVAAGLALYFALAAWGPFISTGLSSDWLIPWVAGYLFLLIPISYDFIFSGADIYPLPFRFILLGVLFMNFVMQLTGGVLSTLWPSYYLFAVIFGALSRLPQALSMVFIILAVEFASLVINHQHVPGRVHAYAGFGLSLGGVSLAASLLMGYVLPTRPSSNR